MNYLASTKRNHHRFSILSMQLPFNKPKLKAMFTKRFILILFVFSSLIATALGFYFFPSVPGIIFPKTELLIFPKGSTYEKEGKKVDSLTNKGLTASALKVVEGIYTKAKTDNNAPQIVKAIIHRIKLE